MGSELGELLLY